MRVTSKSAAKRGDAQPRDAAPEPLRIGTREFTRQRLVEAALDAFRTRGYQQTTVEAIARQAGATVPTFYRYFGSKRELLAPLLEYLDGEVTVTLRELDGLDTRERKSIRKWLDSYMVMWDRVHKLCEAHWEAVNVDRVYARNLTDEAISCISVMKANIARMPDSACGRFKLRMALLVMCLDRVALVVSLERQKSRANEMLDDVAELIWIVLNTGAGAPL